MPGIQIDAALRDRQDDIEELLACLRCGMEPAAVIEAAIARGYDRRAEHGECSTK
jgi:hypothetical protein